MQTSVDIIIMWFDDVYSWFNSIPRSKSKKSESKQRKLTKETETNGVGVCLASTLFCINVWCIVNVDILAQVYIITSGCVCCQSDGLSSCNTAVIPVVPLSADTLN